MGCARDGRKVAGGLYLGPLASDNRFEVNLHLLPDTHDEHVEFLDRHAIAFKYASKSKKGAAIARCAFGENYHRSCCRVSDVFERGEGTR